MAGVSNGVARLSAGGGWTLFTPASGLLDEDTSFVAMGTDGHVWVGVTGPSRQGVARFDAASWHNYVGELDDSYVYAITADL